MLCDNTSGLLIELTVAPLLAPLFGLMRSCQLLPILLPRPLAIFETYIHAVLTSS